MGDPSHEVNQVETWKMIGAIYCQGVPTPVPTPTPPSQTRSACVRAAPAPLRRPNKTSGPAGLPAGQREYSDGVPTKRIFIPILVILVVILALYFGGWLASQNPDRFGLAPEPAVAMEFGDVNAAGRVPASQLRA